MKLKIYTLSITICFLMTTKNAVSQMDILPGAKTICIGSQTLQSSNVQVFDPKNDSGVWNVAIIQRNLEEEDPELEKIIAKRRKIVAQNPAPDVGIDLNTSYKTTVASTAVMESNFEGCTFDGGSPSDNTIAVSKAGFVVAACNSTVNFYDKNNSKIRTYTLPSFAKDITGTFSYDPKVIYDWVYDRFILVFLEGKTAATSKVVIAFSTSGDPTAKWFVYHLSGNVYNDNVWFDFPNIGITENDLFVCGNKFNDKGNSQGSVIFQIVKQTGYKGGGSLKYKIYDTLETQFQDPLFSLVPVSHGQASYGPGMYFVNSIKGGGNEIDISQITDSLNSGKAVLKVTQYNTDFNYNVPLSALMKGTQKQLLNNDCRILGALILKNNIFFCFHADIYNKGYSSLILCRFNTKTGKIDSSTLSGYQTSFGYPNIASIGFGDWDNTLAMTFLASSNKMYPASYYITIEQNFTWAPPTLIKSGDWYYNTHNPATTDERWGDYTGICRWNGNYCPAVVTQTSHPVKRIDAQNVYWGDYGNWITHLVYCNQNSIEKPAEPALNSTIYPNPVNVEFAHLDFNIKHTEKIKIDVYDNEGKWLKTLSNSTLPEGSYSFVVETSTLPNGIYYIHIVNDKLQNLNTQKLVVSK